MEAPCLLCVYFLYVMVVAVCACMVCVCACGVCVCVSRHKSNIDLNMVTGSMVLATGPMALHTRTSVNVSSDAVTPFTLCTPIGEIANLPSLFICCSQRTKSKAS